MVLAVEVSDLEPWKWDSIKKGCQCGINIVQCLSFRFHKNVPLIGVQRRMDVVFGNGCVDTGAVRCSDVSVCYACYPNDVQRSWRHRKARDERY